MAGFCEQVLEEKTGVPSLIRVVDTINHSAQGPDAPATMPPFKYPLKLVLMLKSGRARGRYDLKVVAELPSGESKEPLLQSIQLGGEERGVNRVIQMQMEFTLEGLYWFNVHLDDAILTRIPLRVTYSRLVMQPATP
jgi:hypothetical protein